MGCAYGQPGCAKLVDNTLQVVSLITNWMNVKFNCSCTTEKCLIDWRIKQHCVMFNGFGF